MKMKRIITAMFALLVFSVLAQARPQFGKAESFNDNWKFQLEDVKNASSATFDDSKWQPVELPHDWSVRQPLSPDKASCQGYLPGGIGWYRKTFTLPAQDAGKKTFIYFEGVYNYSEVFVNGTSVGKRPNGYVSFMYDLTPYLKEGQNVVAVRVDHSQDADSRWYTGSGIYRNVWLVTSGQVHLDLWGVYFYTPVVTASKAQVAVSATLRNESKLPAVLSVTHEILDPLSGKVVAVSTQKATLAAGADQKVAQTLSVAKPKLWSVDAPTLYTLRTTVRLNGQEIEHNEQKLGIRSLKFDPNNGFALNGVWTKVKGVCIHHDAGCLGSAVPREVWKRRILNLKEMGCNAIRMSHNPQSPDMYELCDELGMLVMDEAFDEWEYAKKKWIQGWNKGTPKYQGAYAYFEEWSTRDLSDIILRDRNHPSVIMWSIGNEVDYPNDPYSHPTLARNSINQPVQGGYLPNNPPAERLGVIAKRLASTVRGLDTSRPVTAALAGVVMSNETDYPFVLDIAGYNYTEDRYAMDHAKYPKRVIYGSENGHSLEAWKVVRDSSYIFGQFIWTGIDYLGESGAWPSRGFYTGFMDFGGFLKPRGYFRRALWSTRPVAYIGTYPVMPGNRRFGLSTDAWPVWNYASGQTIRVVCYTNAAKAKLMLNGKEVGESKPYDDKTAIIYWDVPYQPGKLEVIGMDETGKQVSYYSVQSSGRPAALVATTLGDKPVENGLAQILIQVVDENGLPVFQSDDEVTCRINGPARLLGLEASNNEDMGDYTDNVQRVYHGRMVAYVKAAGTSGKVTLRFDAPWLKSAEITLPVQ